MDIEMKIKANENRIVELEKLISIEEKKLLELVGNENKMAVDDFVTTLLCLVAETL